MSYLGPLRLHFAGKFQAAVSTVNNDPTHFDTETFKPEFQEYGPNGTKGWWNPRGDADWRLIGCEVKAAFLADGSAAPATDPVLKTTVADSDRLPPAKLVDLDPQQQMVSTIWGLEIRIADADGNTLMRGGFEPVGFMDLWQRAGKAGTDFNACAMYQSVLTEVSWGDVSASPFLAALRAASPDRVLSVKFSVDGYSMNPKDPEFTRGRIVGSIGPGSAAEPRHMTVGRQFVPTPKDARAMLSPAGRLNFCTAVVDAATARVYLDLGNALPTVTPGGEIADVGPLFLRAGSQQICPVPYSSDGWYERSAGIVALPADRPLTAAELGLVEATPLTVGGNGSTGIEEAADYVRADSFVFRCDPGEAASFELVASRLGKPLAAEVELKQEREQLQFPEPEPGLPENAIKFPGKVKTGADGRATVSIATKDPGNPRKYIDGQVYMVRPRLVGDKSVVEPFNLVSLLLWDEFTSADPPTWWGDLQPVFQQYANLYPVMQGFLDLSSYEQVCENRALLLLAFELGTGDPNSMPVTRDLSAKKRQAILAWLRDVGPDGKPLEGTPPPSSPGPAPAVSAEQLVPPELTDVKGGKAAALANRLFVLKGSERP